MTLLCDWNIPHEAVTIVLTQIPCLKIILFSKQQKEWSFFSSFFPAGLSSLDILSDLSCRQKIKFQQNHQSIISIILDKE